MDTVSGKRLDGKFVRDTDGAEFWQSNPHAPVAQTTSFRTDDRPMSDVELVRASTVFMLGNERVHEPDDKLDSFSVTTDLTDLKGESSVILERDNSLYNRFFSVFS